MPDHKMTLEVTGNSREACIALIASWAQISACGKDPMKVKNVKGKVTLAVDKAVSP